HLAMPYTKYFGSAHLGTTLEPMIVSADPSSADFQAPSLALESALRPRFSERRNLLAQFDRYRQEVDSSHTMDAMGQFQQQAAAILTSDTARKAFDLSKEDAAVRDRYGRNPVGQRCLLARRLVEA